MDTKQLPPEAAPQRAGRTYLTPLFAARRRVLIVRYRPPFTRLGMVHEDEYDIDCEHCGGLLALQADRGGAPAEFCPHCEPIEDGPLPFPVLDLDNDCEVI